MNDTYHVAFRRTWDAQKKTVSEGVTLEKAVDYMKALTERDWQPWTKTGLVWTSLNGGTQVCVECDLWITEPHLVPFEVE